MEIEAVTLSELLMKRWQARPWPVDDVAQAVDRYRRIESGLRRWLPESLVRRVDRGFARSNTVHPETAQALYSICRALRPQCVFETGTYWGYSTTYLASALADNREGRIWTFDLYEDAGRHVPARLHSWIEFHRGTPATEAMPPILGTVKPDLFFQDSVHDFEGVRLELQTVAPHLTDRAVVLFHDFVADGVRRAAFEALPGWRIFQLSTGDPQQLGVALRE
jgi:hypothetical protein